MSTKRRLQLPAQTGILPTSPAGTIGTFNIPLGYRYHQINLVYIDGTGAPTDMRTMFADVDILRNGTYERTHSSLELDHLNNINGTGYGLQQVGAGATQRQTQTIFLAEPWRKDKSDTDFMAWSVDAANGFKTFQLNCTLAAAFPATGQLMAWALVDAPIAPPKGGFQSVKKVYRVQIPASGLSNDVNTLDERDAYQTLLLKNPTGAYISSVTLKLGGNLILDNVQQYDNGAQLTNWGLNPSISQVAGSFGFDIVLDGDDPINSALGVNTANAPWLKLNYSAAATGNVIALVERLGTLD
jgi:hypothetical protein